MLCHAMKSYVCLTAKLCVLCDAVMCAKLMLELMFPIKTAGKHRWCMRSLRNWVSASVVRHTKLECIAHKTMQRGTHKTNSTAEVLWSRQKEGLGGAFMHPHVARWSSGEAPAYCKTRGTPAAMSMDER